MTRASMLGILAVALWLGGFDCVQAAYAAEYCAFDVVVRTPTGVGVSETVVSLMTEDGRTFASVLTDSEGRARLCDAPDGLVHIQVGGRRCGAVTVGYLARWWMRTRPVAVTYTNCVGEEWAVPGQCLVTVRVRDEKGVPVMGVRFRPLEGNGWAFETQASDSFGRVFAMIEYGKTLEAKPEAEGYMPTAVVQGCNRGEGSQKQQIVTLKKATNTSSDVK